MTNYIGRDLDKISNIEILDNITFDGSQSYTLQKGGVNFTPNSAQSIILGIDGITQIGNFSVNGSTIDFGVAVANTSTCNYIIHLGTGLLTAPSDGSVTNAKLGTAPTLEAKGSGSTAGGVRYFCEQSSHHVTLRAGQHSGFSSGSFELKLPTAQGGANTFLKNDGSGNLSFASAGESNTPYFNAVSTTVSDNFTEGALYTINNYNSVLVDTCSGFATGTGRYTPNVAGHYYFSFQCHVYTQSASDMKMVYGQLFKNGSGGNNYSQRCIQQINFNDNNGNGFTVSVQGIFQMNGTSDYVYSAVVGDTNSGADARFAGESNYTWFRGFLISRT